MFGFDDVTFALQIDFFMPFQYNRVSARAASRDKCVYPRPVRHGAVGWTRHMREPPARGRPFIRSNSTCRSARLTTIKAAT